MCECGGGQTGGLGLAYAPEAYGKADQLGLLYSTGNSTQYSVIIHVGQEPEREWTCAQVKVNPSVVQQELPQHSKSAIL